MATQGPNNAGTGADNGGGDSAWSNPNNIVTFPLSAASNFNVDRFTNYLLATNFGFTLPVNATIVGITAGISRANTGGSIDVLDHSVKIILGGVVSGTEHAAGGSWPHGAAIQTYGSATDLWGLTNPTPTQINASNFGLAISADNNTEVGGIATIYAFVTITITYVLPVAFPVISTE